MELTPNPGGGQRTLPRVSPGDIILFSHLIDSFKWIFSLSMFRKNERI